MAIVKPIATKIDRAHRVGKYNREKKRPVIVKFNFFQDKLSIKERVKGKREEISVRVSDQFPKCIQEIPILIQAKSEEKSAYTSFNKLYIHGEIYRVSGVQVS